MKRISLAMTDETHRQLRMIAAHADVSQPEMVARLIGKAYEEFRQSLVEEARSAEKDSCAEAAGDDGGGKGQEEAPRKPKRKNAPRQLTIPPTVAKRPK